MSELPSVGLSKSAAKFIEGTQQCFCVDGVSVCRSEIDLSKKHIGLFARSSAAQIVEYSTCRPFGTVFRPKSVLSDLLGSRGRPTVGNRYEIGFSENQKKYWYIARSERWHSRRGLRNMLEGAQRHGVAKLALSQRFKLECVCNCHVIGF